MADGQLLATCGLLFASAYGCALVPRLLPVTRERLGAVSALAAGLLLGSALCVMLPEGFEALRESEVRHGGPPRARALCAELYAAAARRLPHRAPPARTPWRNPCCR